MNAVDRTHRNTPIALLTCLVGTGILLGALGGCQSRDDSWKYSMDLDEKYIIGPTIAGELGLRCDWQSEVPVKGSQIKQVGDLDGDILVVDTLNRVTLLRPTDGNQIWHAAPMPSKEKVLGMDRIDYGGRQRVFITTDTDLFVLDANTGQMITRQNLPNGPITRTARYGDDVIFGSSDGRVVFHDAPLGYEIRANRLRGQIGAAPVVHDSEVVAVSDEGEVLLMNAGDASRLWARNLTGAIESEPAFNDNGIYVATLGQSLWCLDHRSGEVKWKYFTESPLRTGPTALGDRVFQFVPGEGLICFEADPRNAPRGRALWTNSDVKGEITTVIGNNLLIWDESSETAFLVDADRGSVRFSSKLPKVRSLHAFRDGRNDLTLMATSISGIIQRLESRGR